jgi:aminoglycoside phosphotransferase (APT) family kinase protein
MSRLYHAEFAVPRTLGFCDDATVLGFEFYVMSMEEGCVFWDGRLPQLDRMTRRSVYVAEIETLADLHDLDPASLGLGDFGSRGNYCARQISRWIKQYRSSETKHIPAMERLVEWLPRTVPEQAMVSIVHGDYRLNNLIFEADAPRVKAVLDWELATLGDPLADFTNLLIGWVVPCDGRAMIGGVDFQSLGIPTLEEAIQIYCDRSKSGSIPNINWYLAYNLFRLAAIMQGIAGRSRDGTASSPRARQEGETATALADAAWEFAGKAGA